MMTIVTRSQNFKPILWCILVKTTLARDITFDYLFGRTHHSQAYDGLKYLKATMASNKQ